MRFTFGLVLVAASILPAAASHAADAAHGKALFATCGECHLDPLGEKAPSLDGVVGRKAGSTDFAYSSAMKSSGITWTPDRLQAFLQNPTAVVPGTKMGFGGTDSASDAADIVAYLQTLKS